MTPQTEKKDYLPKAEIFERLVGPQADKREYEIIYLYVFTFLYWHIAGLYGLYLCFTCAKWASILNCKYSIQTFNYTGMRSFCLTNTCLYMYILHMVEIFLLS